MLKSSHNLIHRSWHYLIIKVYVNYYRLFLGKLVPRNTVQKGNKC